MPGDEEQPKTEKARVCLPLARIIVTKGMLGK